MKKIFGLLVCLFAIFAALPFCGCKNTTLYGNYTVSTLSAMGLEASQKSFESYSTTRSENDKEYNALYNPMQLLFNMHLKLNSDNTAKLTIFDFEKLLSSDAHYLDVVAEAKSKGYVFDGNLVITNLRWAPNKAQINAYFVYAIDEAGLKMDLSEIWGDKLFAADHINARIQNNKLACKIKVCVYEKENDAKSSVALTTNVTIVMSK